MITLVVKAVIKEDKIEEYKDITKELEIESKKEKGCISYSLYEDINNPQILTFIEVWKDEEAIKIHNNSEHFKRLAPKLRELRDGIYDVNFYKCV